MLMDHGNDCFYQIHNDNRSTRALQANNVTGAKLTKVNGFLLYSENNDYRAEQIKY